MHHTPNLPALCVRDLIPGEQRVNGVICGEARAVEGDEGEVFVECERGVVIRSQLGWWSEIWDEDVLKGGGEGGDGVRGGVVGGEGGEGGFCCWRRRGVRGAGWCGVGGWGGGVKVVEEPG
jgi:hypothetical protein